MEFLKNDLNLKLIFSIALLLLLFAGFSAYYQKTLINITSEYNEKNAQFEEVTAMFVAEETKAEEISKLNEKSQKDKEFLETGYNDLNNENQVLKKDLEATISELTKTESELAEKKNNFDLLQSRFQSVERSLISANEDLSRLSARIGDLCNELKSAGIDSKDC